MSSKAHAFTRKIFHWFYCAHCGLVLLKNDASRAAAKRRCPGLDDDGGGR